MVRVIVLGATGYIGLTTCLALRRSSHIVYGLARTPAKAQILAQNEIIPIFGSVEGGEYLQAIEKFNIDVVIDAAGANDGSAKVLEGLKAVGGERLARRGERGGRLGFVYTSGTWVHGSSTTRETRLNDLNPAGIDNDTGCPFLPPGLVAWRPKLEEAILDARDMLDVMVMRPACLYGRGSFIWSAWFGELRKAAEEMAPSVELQCSPDAVLSLVHVDEVGSALAVAAEQVSHVGGAGSSVYPVFDIVSSRERAGGILEGVARAMGFQGEVKFVKPTDPFAEAMSTSARLDSTRARDLLGWEGKRVFGMGDEIELVTAAWMASNAK